MGERLICLACGVTLKGSESVVLIWPTCYPIRQGVIRRNYPTGDINELGVCPARWGDVVMNERWRSGGDEEMEKRGGGEIGRWRML